MGLPRAHGNCRAVPTLAIHPAAENNGLIDGWYLGPFNCPSEDVIHVMMTRLPGSLLRLDKPCTVLEHPLLFTLDVIGD